jgi:hypothetical protein
MMNGMHNAPAGDNSADAVRQHANFLCQPVIAHFQPVDGVTGRPAAVFTLR